MTIISYQCYYYFYPSYSIPRFLEAPVQPFLLAGRNPALTR